jgi:hypothetical protein
MFDIQTPAARNTDPITSHLAAAEHTSSGERAHQQHQTYSAVKAFPGLTSFELAMKTGLGRHMLGRRLSEVELAGLIRRSEPKRCLISGKLALTWVPTPAQGELDLAA